MLILTIRTDKPEAELGLFDNARQLAGISWQAHRQLGETIHRKIAELLESQHKTLLDLGGVVVFQGPGSFTGLRIGLSVANALADGYSLPIVGTMDGDWISRGCTQLASGVDQHVVMPEYGAPVHITTPKK